MLIKTVLTLLGTILAAILLVAIHFHLSLWFLWHLLPTGDLKIAVDSTQPSSTLINALVESAQLPLTTATLTHNVKRYSYVHSNTEANIALVPQNPFLFRARNKLINELTHSQWQVTNYYLIIIGSKTSPPQLPSLADVASTSYQTMFSRRYSRQPTVIATVNNSFSSFFPQKTALVGTTTSDGRKLKLIAAPDLNSLPNFPIKEPSSPDQADYLAINVPGNIIQAMPPDIINQWNKALHARLGFASTQPEIINYLATQQTVSLSLNDTAAAIATIGDPATQQAVFRQWVQTEETFLRPQPHAFLLPDNTLGYELVKGDPAPVFTEPDSSGCLAPSTEHLPLWLCQNSHGTSLATSKELALRQLSLISPYIQNITLGRNYLHQLDYAPIKYLRSLVIHTSAPYTLITAQLEI